MDKKIIEKRIATVRLERNDIDDAVLEYVNREHPETNGMDITRWELPFDNVIDIEFNLNTYKDLGKPNPYENPNCVECNPDISFDDIEDSVLTSELESRGFYVYGEPDEAIGDVSYHALKQGVEDGGGYVYDAPTDAFADVDDDELIEEIHNRSDDDTLFKVLESMESEFVLKYLINHKGYKLKKVCATSRCGCC